MRMTSAIALVFGTFALVAGLGLSPVAAQGGAGRVLPGNVGWRHPVYSGTGKVPPATSELASKGDVNSLAFKWMWYMGMLRGPEEGDFAAMFDLRKATGTIQVQGQPCKLENYRASTNWQVPGQRVHYTCTLPNGQKRTHVEVVSGEFAWDEDIPGAELVAGAGKATPNPGARAERLIRLWAGPWSAPKAAVLGGSASSAALEGGRAVVSFPIPGVAGATAKAWLNNDNQAERIEVRHNNVVSEFTYEKYGDYNPEDDRIQCYTPGHIVEKRNGATVLDINVVETHCGNLYVVMPVPASVRSAGAAR